jgi:hypothetical protein
MTLESRVQALLDVVEADRQRRCDAIRRDAAQSAEATRTNARNEARQRLRIAFANERELREQRLGAAQAKLQTHRRLHDQRRAAALLEAGWQRLPEVLCRRWNDAQARRQWVDRVVTEARSALRPGSWRITHADLWPAEEQARVAAALTRDGTAPPQFVADASIPAGLKIARDANLIDGTLAGMLADRADIAARLLRHMED